MKASELRVGNYYNNNGVRQIEPHDIDFCYRNNESFCKLNKPISLTEEWLIKFGFKKCERSGAYGLTIISRYMSIDYYPRDNQYDLTIFTHGAPMDIKYVHQLQNLYFALTGNELKQL